MRGTIYGLYDVSEQIGVSPWYWWADVPIKKAEGVWALDGRKTQHSPSVKYRGIFINDEQPALTNWIKYVSLKAIWKWVADVEVVIIMLLVLMVLDSIISSTHASLSCCSGLKLITSGRLCGPACSMWMIPQINRSLMRMEL